MSNRSLLPLLVACLSLGCAADVDDLGRSTSALSICAGAVDTAQQGNLCTGTVSYDSGDVPHTSFGNGFPAGGYTPDQLLEGDWSLIACSCEDTLIDMCRRRSPGNATTCRLGTVDPEAASETCTVTRVYYVIGNYACNYANPQAIPTDRYHDYDADPACTAYPRGAQVPLPGWAFEGTCRMTCSGACRVDRTSGIVEDPYVEEDRREDPHGEPHEHGDPHSPGEPHHPHGG